MTTASHGNDFGSTGGVWGELPMTGKFSSQRPISGSLMFHLLVTMTSLWTHSELSMILDAMAPMWRHFNVNSDAVACYHRCFSKDARNIPRQMHPKSTAYFMGCIMYPNTSVVMVTTLPSLSTPEAVIPTTSGVASNGKVGNHHYSRYSVHSRVPLFADQHNMIMDTEKQWLM